MEIIAHRGYWLESQEKNSFKAFERAISNGFGIETDLRDYHGKIVISHDLPTEKNKTLDEFLKLVSKNKKVTLALNIKCDGLQDLLQRNEYLGEHKHFYFDMSIPDCLTFNQKNMCYFSRVSDVEPTALLYKDAAGIWLDNFSSNKLNLAELNKVLEEGKKVALVSPELHGYEYTTYWEQLKNHIRDSQSSENILLCTDFPMLAKEFFNV
ncbi:hypothetical protein [Photobacterium phosphoreum]|uniref:hypothetical protein n=1 Tax=Photobacterium phosphoreum TaxID=659 RepID=UPI0005D428DD|nr:hypothetical protein [Photobacterium phosphoreum]KJF85819.1 hypothetical protein UB41_13820 [Photobacterium phosphoreum]PQJ91730.1 hypothetical protein BTO21_08475 [Photobacterium phosphoreum]PSV67098.1 hypothetical protein CTM77_19010 [Photobacterium phosphoreum]